MDEVTDRLSEDLGAISRALGEVQRELPHARTSADSWYRALVGLDRACRHVTRLIARECYGVEIAEDDEKAAAWPRRENYPSRHGHSDHGS